jgi:D-3-phosphoglycerate dehydrogenase
MTQNANANSSDNHRVLVYERMDPTDESLNWLASHGIEVTRGRAMWEAPFARYLDDEFIAAARGFRSVMGASGVQFSRTVLEALPELRFISKLGVGVDNIDLETATSRGVLVSNTPEDSEVADVAEHTIALILGLRKKLTTWTPDYMQRGGWRPGFFADTLAGNTIGLVGLGKIARAVVQRLTHWEVKILAFDPGPAPAPGEVEQTSLSDLLRRSDIVSLHATPTSQNRHLINQAAFELMKPGALLINTARAWLVDTNALLQVLKSGRLGGAALDVYDLEPPDPNDPLFRQDHVIVTPHTAAWTRKGLEALGWHGARNLCAMLCGEGHADIVNPAAAHVTPPQGRRLQAQR